MITHRIHRIVAMIVLAVVVLGLIAACSSQLAPPPTAAPASTDESDPTKLPPVELRYVIFGKEQPDLDEVMKAFSDLVQQKINATVKVDWLDGGAFNDKVNLMNAGGEAYDLVFTAPWRNNYYQNVNNGSLIPLDDLLPKYAPKLWASMPPTTWDAARVNGKIYGVINQQIFVKPFGPIIRKDLADKYGLDLTAISGYEDPAFTDFMQKVKAGESDLKSVMNNLPTWHELWGYDPIDQGLFVTAVAFDDPSAKVVSWVETDGFKRLAKLLRAWQVAGFYPAEPMQTADADAALKAGQLAMTHAVVKPGGDLEAEAKYGQPFVSKAFAPIMLTTGGVVATLTGVSATSENPERAVMLLELINTDPEVYNLLAKGIEGKHWTWVDKDKKLIKLAENSGYNPNQDWAFGNQFNAYYIKPEQVGVWEETYQLNQNAKPSPVLGFTFDRKPVETEIAQVSGVVSAKLSPIYKGEVEDVDAAIADLVAELKKAGLDKIIEEANRQVQAWKAGN
jgi:putative aldouronate transport system substrate-binding protein